MKAANLAGGGINVNFPRCAACTLVTPNPGFWSNTIAVGASLGRPICESPVAGRCDYTP